LPTGAASTLAGSVTLFGTLFNLAVALLLGERRLALRTQRRSSHLERKFVTL
jgi:hypothetical protein